MPCTASAPTKAVAKQSAGGLRFKFSIILFILIPFNFETGVGCKFTKKQPQLHSNEVSKKSQNHKIQLYYRIYPMINISPSEIEFEIGEIYTEFSALIKD